MRLAINGFGRIGRSVFRAIHERGLAERFDVAAINELADLETIRYLTRYDSTHGHFPGEVVVAGDALVVNDRAIAVSHVAELDELRWTDIDIVLECSGAFDERQLAEKHLTAGARRVLFSQPARPDVDATIVCGVNEHLLRSEHRIVSAASCTTNCVVPVLDCLHRHLEVQAGVISTIHSVMNDQPMLDSYHHTDLRKTRAAIQSMIPVDTRLARGIDRVLPQLAGRMEAQAMRVPTQNVSVIDLSVTVGRDTDVAEVNRLLGEAAAALPAILGYTEEPLASCDFNHDPRSGIVDASQTRVAGKRLVKVLVWFDNEWGYANRMIDVLCHWQGLITKEH
ncbi:MAG: type I glyceraldehyde-3-phosphate dehydrogenase [Bacteroidales bacterium]|nr:type I glyceraldehyde-3-phosphate dehydrogenase [Bacteroidales bacterium]